MEFLEIENTGKKNHSFDYKKEQVAGHQRRLEKCW